MFVLYLAALVIGGALGLTDPFGWETPPWACQVNTRYYTNGDPY